MAIHMKFYIYATNPEVNFEQYKHNMILSNTYLHFMFLHKLFKLFSHSLSIFWDKEQYCLTHRMWNC